MEPYEIPNHIKRIEYLKDEPSCNVLLVSIKKNPLKKIAKVNLYTYGKNYLGYCKENKTLYIWRGE